MDGDGVLKQFDEPIERTGTMSVKWDNMKEVFGAGDLLPMWVADMDFRPPKAVIDALKARVEHGVFGYSIIPDSTDEAIQNWLKKRHHWEIEQSWLLYSTGVVPSLGMAIQAFTKPGDRILIQSPVYQPFFRMIETNGRKVVNSPLLLKNGRYEIDFADFEEKCQNNVKVFILCSPHNPGGRVWHKGELQQLAELCKKYEVLIIADEIHADLVAPPYQHTPIAAIDKAYQDFIVTCIAPTKTFNLAGLQAASMIVPNPSLRKKLSEIQAQQGFFTLNTFGIIGMEAAYRNGSEWLDELLLYIRQNVEIVHDFIQKELPALQIMEPEGSYLIWIDCRKTGLSDADISNRLLQTGKLALEPGRKYGPGGEGFIRMNVACTKQILRDGLARLAKAFQLS